MRLGLTVIALWLALGAATQAAPPADWTGGAPGLTRSGEGIFERLWGVNVDQGGGTGLEACTVAANCTAGTASSLRPRDAAVAPNGNVYVVDGSHNRIDEFTPDGAFVRGFGKGVGTGDVCTSFATCAVGADGPTGGALNLPVGVGIDGSGHVFVAEQAGARVSEFAGDGTFMRLWGRRVDDATPGDGAEICPAAHAASCTLGLSGGGQAGIGGQIEEPSDVAADAAGNVYVSEGDHRIQKFASDLQFVWTAGSFVNNNPNAASHDFCDVAADCKEGGSSVRGGGFFSPTSIAVGAGNDVYVAEGHNSRISQFSSSGTWKRTWGGGVAGGVDPEVCTVSAQCAAGSGGNAGGSFFSLAGVATDAQGHVYTTDSRRVQRFGADGSFQRAWGVGVDPASPGAFGLCTVAADCMGGDESAVAGGLNTPGGLGVSPAGTVFVADNGNERVVRYGAGTAPPAAPTVSGVTPAGPANNNAPKVTGTAAAGTTVTLYGNATCTGTALGTGTATDFGATGVAITVPDDSTTTVYATATGPGGASACSTSFVTYVEQSTGTLHFSGATASVAEDAGNAVLTVSRDGDISTAVTATWTTAAGTATSPADFTGGTATVSFGAGAAQSTLSVPIVNDTDAEGDETFTVTLSAPSTGAALGTPATVTVTIVDDDDIDTSITDGPSGPTNDATPTFAFTADPAAGATFQCAVDLSAFAACSPPFTAASLADGSHTFRVRAVRPNGVQDPTPATRTFFVDTAAPTVTLAAAGDAATGGYNGAVTVSASTTDPAPSPGPATAACVVDPPSPPAAAAVTGSCPATVTGAGQHTVYAVATDAAGNRSAVTSTSFRIFPDRPDTKIISDPFTALAASSATFRFEANPGDGATFECSLDGAGFAACANPLTVSGLKDGSHTFRVRAVSAGGLADQTPAEQAFVVDTVAPAVSIDVSPVPNAGAQVSSNTYTGAVQVHAVFGDPDPSSGVAGVGCSLDPATVPTTPNEVRAGSCVSPATSVGDHVAYAVAYDTAGNASGIVSTRFAIVSDLDTQIGGPSGTVWTRQPTFAFTSSTPSATIYCRIDGAAFAPCASPYTTLPLTPGPHTIQAAAQLGNSRDPTPASQSFTVGQTVHRDHGCTISPFAGTTRTSTLGCQFASPCTKARVSCKPALEACPAGAVCSITTHLTFDTPVDRFTGGPVICPGEITHAQNPNCNFPNFFGTWSVDARIAKLPLSGCGLSLFTIVGSGDVAHPNGDPRGRTHCESTQTTSFFGRGGPIDTYCFAIAYRSGYQTFDAEAGDYGPEAQRRFSCDVDMGISAASNLEAVTAGTNVDIYVAGPGALVMPGDIPNQARTATVAAKKRTAAFKTIHQTVRTAGSRPLKLRLTRIAKRRLRTTGRLAVRVHATFTPVGGTRTTRTSTIVLTRAVNRKAEARAGLKHLCKTARQPRRIKACRRA